MNVTVVTPDVVGERMAGPGIRAWHLAHELAKHFPTALVAKREGLECGGSAAALACGGAASGRDESGGRAAALQILERGTAEARDAIKNADVVIGQPARGFRKRRGQKIIFDLFDPNVLELRELYGSSPSIRQRIHLAAEWARLSYALGRADLLICAARKQRDFYDALQSGDAGWIEVPFGIDMEEVSGCAKPKDNLVVWGGGTWEWLDPATAVDAVVRLNREGLRCKMLFLGRGRPNRDLVDRRREDRFDALIRKGEGHVSANDEWIPYRERLSWLRAGKVAIMLHRRTAEAEYSIRTRIFDAIATGTPVVATAGGFAAELVQQEGLGIVVPPGDADAVTSAIRRLLTDDTFHSDCVERLERIRPRFAWPLVTRPLVDAITEWQKSGI